MGVAGGALLVLGALGVLPVSSSSVEAHPPGGGRARLVSRGRGKGKAKKKRKKRDPNTWLIVQDFIVLPKTPGAPMRRRRYRRYYRRTTSLYLKSSRKGNNLCRLSKGLRVKVLGKKGDHLKVKTLGPAEVVGYIPDHTIGLRVIDETDILGSPSAKNKIGKAQPGVLVRVEKTRGKYTQAMLMGPCPVRVWFATKDLGVADGGKVKYGSYPRGSRMVVKKGPIYDKKGGKKIGEIVEDARAYRKTTKGKWSQIHLSNYRYYTVKGWVPKKRLQYGYYGYWRGNGYSRSTSNYSSGNMRAVMRLPLYLEKDDAYPTAVLAPGTRFRVTNTGSRWVKIYFSGSVYFHAYAKRAPGTWVPRSSYSRPVPFRLR